ncbi:MAG: adenylate/guanylate cyclase domain-containing protein [Gammaproteobacteria bacterium]|nr:adenylate/guanylate cyclase domain-containing protein [Gammaproteobacteria bacterium]MBU1415849.1 adenylate/guanylate cyclase domain-containing protein [Gammaproteobacteria bacterium]
MTATPASASFLDRLRTAGVEPGDSEEQRLNKSLLMFATGLISVASMLWVAIYWALGPEVSSTPPLAFELVLVGNLLLYIATRNFDFFRVTQLALFLFGPFAMQWGMGTFIDSSGIVLWGLLAPVGAILFFGVRESIAWFFAWVFMILMSGFFDFYLAPPVNARLPFAVPVQTVVVFFALNFVAVATIIYLLLRYSIQEKQKIQARLQEAHVALEAEQERSERLLLNILPSPVAERLKASDQTIADGFADVTVMFADIVEFTRMAAHMSPEEVFAMLNRVFSAFDELAEKFGLERIKTIGDAYMVAGGLNQNNACHSEAIADMAIAMRDLLQRDFSINATKLQARIGIGSGPVVAGVVGKKKFIYDVWGDTVNIASRVTSEGSPGMIQCDVPTWERLRDRFEFMDPRTLHLKGKGDMTVYRLLGRKAPSVSAASAPGESTPVPAR